MSKKDISVIFIFIVLLFTDMFFYMDFMNTEQKFQKTIDEQKEILYNKDMQIREMRKLIFVQDKNLRELRDELEYYKQNQSRFVGVHITHYSSEETGSSITASGVEAIAGRTVACNFLPIGTHVIINDHEYIVEDIGLMPDNVVDIFVNSVEEANSLGTYCTTMEILQ